MSLKYFSFHSGLTPFYFLPNLNFQTITDMRKKTSDQQTLCDLFKASIERLNQLGQTRTSETYSSSYRSFMRFRGGKDVLISSINSDLILDYEAYLRSRGITSNTISFYMRTLRAVYNRSKEIDDDLLKNPFRHVYTGIDKTLKRGLPLSIIKEIKKLNLSKYPSDSYARDMFLFSLYTRGMSFIDMAFLKKSDLKEGVLTYQRQKNKQTMSIHWEKCMQQLIENYNIEESPYLLPIITKPGNNEREQYKSAIYRINRHLKKIGYSMGLTTPLTMYVARHSWASIAHNKHIPISIISEGLGHHSEKTTRIYLSSLDTTQIDHANREILKGL